MRDGGHKELWIQVEAALSAHGLILLGGFYPVPGDEVPALAGGQSAGTLFVIGNTGLAVWQAFAASPEAADGATDPLNRWSERLLTALADAHGGQALFPFGGPPYRPFVAWAKRAAPVRESPLGMLIHPEYGLWHAYRGALAFTGQHALPPRDARPVPCDSCADKPCLTTCPVRAFGPYGYDTDACVGHIRTPQGEDCMDLGCRARRACPVGRGYHYGGEQAAFHMRAFLDARQAIEGDA